MPHPRTVPAVRSPNRQNSPGDAGQVGDEPPEVLLSYSVMIAAGREREDGTSALISAT